MAVKIELKRSSVPGKAPTLSQLDLGELAINTYDGRVYFKKDTGVSQSIVELLSSGGSVSSASYADFAVTASYALTASFLLGDLYRIASGSVTASITPNFGFLVNTNTQITGTLNVGINSGSSSDFFLIKDINTNKEYLKLNSEGVFSIASFNSPPQVIDNGMYFDTTGNFYVASGT
jgi:hypothetical protein